jgi:hypothetical protein
MSPIQKAGQRTTSLNNTNFCANFLNDHKWKNLSSKLGKNSYIQLKIPLDVILMIENFRSMALK